MDPPQFDAWTTGEHPAVVRAMAELARRCDDGDTRACQTHRLNASQYAGNRQRNERCLDGDLRACDEIRCLARGDREACARGLIDATPRSSPRAATGRATAPTPQ